MIKILLTLSHGQSQVERSFPINKDVVSNNMAEDSVIAHHRVYDRIQCLDGPMEQCITPEMLQDCRVAYRTYVNHMEDNKKQSVESEKRQKEKGNMGRIESSTKKEAKVGDYSYCS